MSEQTSPTAAVVALIRRSRAGALATVADGQPFASLVTPAAAPDRSLLLLLSGLSPHTRHLRQEGRCSIMLADPPVSANPQTAPRISLQGVATPEPDPALKARWVALHPYAAFYAELADFQLWRFRAAAGQFVGGFASAHRLSQAQLTPDPDAVAQVAAHEPGVIGHCNADHADAMDLLAQTRGGVGTGWRMVACDVDGCDLALEDRVIRVEWPETVASPGEIRKHLVWLVQLARKSVAPETGPDLTSA